MYIPLILSSVAAWRILFKISFRPGSFEPSILEKLKSLKDSKVEVDQKDEIIKD